MNFQTIILQLGQGMLVTVEIFFLTLLFSLPLGLLVAFGRMSKNVLLKGISKIYISIMRGTPLMLQLIVVYFGPYYLFGSNLKGYRFPAIIIAFAVNYAAYFAEIYRGGIKSIPKGQYEAGQVLGMTKAQIFVKVVLFQVIKKIVPPMGNEIITLVKDTSLSSVIAIPEVLMNAKDFSMSGLIWPLFYSAIFFLAFCGILTIVFSQLEKRLNYYKG